MPTPIPYAAQVAGEEGAAAAAPVEAKGEASTEETKEGGAMVAAESGAVDFEAMFHRKHDVHEGVIKFNMKPKTGIKYLREVCGLEETPEATAKFLLTTEGLDKVAVGEYLGGGADFNRTATRPLREERMRGEVAKDCKC